MRAPIRYIGPMALALLVACGNDNSGSGGEIFGNRGNGEGSPAEASPTPAGGPVILKAPSGTDITTLQAAAPVVQDRLTRMNVQVSSVTAGAEGVAVTSSADAYQLQAAVRRDATSIATISSTALGPCNGSGQASVGPAARCYVLGPSVTGLGAVSSAVAQAASGAGWKVDLAIDPDQYRSFRAPLEAAGPGPLALVSDGVVVLAFDPRTPALQSSLGPALTEEQARQAAAALVVHSELAVALEAPALPQPHGARVNLDFWTAALGVRICGTWLANAPTAGLDTGVHSHGDGLVYVHPFMASEAGEHATLGLFLERGKWSATQDRLELWDGQAHHSGDACTNGGPARVRWWVDGVEQQGNPSDLVPQNGQVIVLSFDSDPLPPGPPPQMAALYLPTLGAATS